MLLNKESIKEYIKVEEITPFLGFLRSFFLTYQAYTMDDIRGTAKGHWKIQKR